MWEFLYTNAAPIGGLIVLLVTILEFVFYNKTQTHWKRGLILVQSTIVSLAFLALIYLTWSPKNVWENWKEDVVHNFEECLELPKYAKHPSNEFVCLSNTVKSTPFPNEPFRKGEVNDAVNSDYSDSLMRAINARTAMEVLMSDESLSNILRETYGIYPNLFLGTGLTKPNEEVSGRRNGVREYFVRNFCADKDKCKKIAKPNLERYPTTKEIWTWQFSNDEAKEHSILGKKVSEIIFEMEDFRTGQGFEINREKISQYLTEGQTQKQTILIRFATFKPEYYVGTVGHPNRKLTFFSDFREVHDYSLREASQLSGIPPKEKDNSKDYFIWLIILDPAELDYKSASWDQLLEDIIDSAE